MPPLRVAARRRRLSRSVPTHSHHHAHAHTHTCSHHTHTHTHTRTHARTHTHLTHTHRFAKRTLLEEGHATQHLLLMWQMIARHPDAFYPARGLFSSQIINSLSKLALATNRRAFASTGRRAPAAWGGAFAGGQARRTGAAH
jgi:hypothetical protein